jgi:hypothetical protein
MGTGSLRSSNGRIFGSRIDPQPKTAANPTNLTIERKITGRSCNRGKLIQIDVYARYEKVLRSYGHGVPPQVFISLTEDGGNNQGSIVPPKIAGLA